MSSTQHQPFWERIDTLGSETRWVAHLYGTTLTVTRQTVDKWTGNVAGPGISAIDSPAFASRQEVQRWLEDQVSPDGAA
jgi:hypothetical protein